MLCIRLQGEFLGPNHREYIQDKFRSTAASGRQRSTSWPGGVGAREAFQTEGTAGANTWRPMRPGQMSGCDWSVKC